jgi:copper transport protein
VAKPARLVVRALVGASAAVGMIVLAAAPVSAHAVLLSTNPVDGAVLPTPPSEVVLRFDEAVEIDLGSVRVLSTSGARVDEGNSFHPDGQASAVAVDLTPHLAKGTYVVAWRVVSDDSHPVHGDFIFSVGTASGLARARAIAATLGVAAAGTAVGVTFWFVRVLELASLIVLVGTAFAVTIAWPEGGNTRRVRRILAVAWLAALISTVLGVGLQGVYASALPFWDLARASLVSAVLHTRYGEVALVRLALLVGAVPILAIGVRSSGTGRRARMALLAAAALVGLALLATPGLAGHAATGMWSGFGVPADIVHLGAASAWVGGLLVLAAIIIPGVRPEDRPAKRREVMLRVSAINFGSVAVIVATGVFLAIRQIGSWSGLISTTYGQLLIAKAAIVVVVIGIGAVTRQELHGRLIAWRPAYAAPAPLAGPPDTLDKDRGRSAIKSERPHHPKTFAFAVLAELVLIAAVLGVTGALINSVPPRQLQTVPFTGTWNVLGVQVNAIIEPSAAGPGNEFHFYVLGADGGPKAIPELKADISLPARRIGPIEIPLVVAGPGHYQNDDVYLPLSGSWLMKITVRTTQTDEQVIRVNLPVH